MGAPMPDMEPVENASAEALLSSLKTIDPGERRKHASVFNYWLSIRGPRQFPPIRDLDPLEISDAGPWSVLLEMIGGGEDATVRHFGQAIRGETEIEKIGEAPSPSLLSCIHAKLPIVAACREAFAFEEEYEGDSGTTRCWVTLLPFSANGSWIDYVYGYVSVDPASGAEAVDVEPEAGVEELPQAVEEAEEAIEAADEPLPPDVEAQEPEPFTVPLGPLDESEALAPPEAVDEVPLDADQAAPEEADAIADELFECGGDAETDESDLKPGFSAKFRESLASVSDFYGKIVQSAPVFESGEPVEAPVYGASDEPVAEAVAESVADEGPPADEPAEIITEPVCEVEGTLHSKLTDVRALAEEAREAQVRSNMALYEGLSAAYDFALDAEEEPEEYLRLVEAQGLKIQLRSPMKPVVKLAFDGMCDEPTIRQLEAVLAWALKHDLPRGTLAERIQAEGGLGPILQGKAA